MGIAPPHTCPSCGAQGFSSRLCYTCRADAAVEKATAEIADLRRRLALMEAEGVRLREALTSVLAEVGPCSPELRQLECPHPTSVSVLDKPCPVSAARAALSSSPIAERAAEVLEAAKRVAEGESAPLVQAVRALRAAEGGGA